MRSLLLKLGVFASATALVFFCSCERHHPGELPDHTAHGKPGEGHGPASGHDEKHDGPGHGKGDGQGHGKADGTGHGHDDGHDHGAGAHGQPASPAAAPVGTPAQFFPATSPAAPVTSPAPPL